MKQPTDKASPLFSIAWNGTKEGRMPEFELYDAIELGTCYDENGDLSEDEKEEQGASYIRIDACEFASLKEYQAHADKYGVIHTLYGHLKQGGVEAFHDCDTVLECRNIAEVIEGADVWEPDDFDWKVGDDLISGQESQFNN